MFRIDPEEFTPGLISDLQDHFNVDSFSSLVRLLLRRAVKEMSFEQAKNAAKLRELKRG